MDTTTAVIRRVTYHDGTTEGIDWPGPLAFDPLYRGRGYDHDTIYVPRQFLDGYDRGLLSPAFLAETQRETQWVPLPWDIPEFPAVDEEAIGRGTLTCPVCKGAEATAVFHKGEVTSIILRTGLTCPCKALRVLWRIWGNPTIIPQRYTRVTLDTLTADPTAKLDMRRQEEIIAEIKANPDDSYLLVGAPGTGKTHIMMALVRHAMAKWAQRRANGGEYATSVWYATVPGLLMDTTAWKTRGMREEDDSVKRPSILHTDIPIAARHGYRPVLALDELDKFNATEAKLADLQELVNAVYNHEGQLFATCNADAKSLEVKWRDYDMAGTITRRIGSGTNAHTIVFE